MGDISGVHKVKYFFLILIASISPAIWTIAADDQTKPVSKRIVSLCLPVTEIICQLGLEDKIVGVCEGDCPDKLKDRPRVGRAFGIQNVESVIALKPDLVFCWGDGILLKDKGLTVFSVSTNEMDGVIKLVQGVGELLGEKERATGIADSMKQKLERIDTKTKRLKDKPLVYFEAGTLGKTRGPGSLTHELIDKAGGINLAGKEKVPFPLLSSEFIIASNPDIILVEDFGESNEGIMARSGWQDLKAVKNRRIYRCPSYFTNYSPRCLEGLEQFTRWFHPEEFKE